MGAALRHRELADWKTRNVAGKSAAALFSLAAVLELARMQSDGAPWPGFTAETDWLFSLLAIVLWIGSAFVLAARRREQVLLSIAGAFALLAFGLIGTAAGARLGVAYVALALMTPILMGMAFGGRTELGRRAPPAAGRSRGPREVF